MIAMVLCLDLVLTEPVYEDQVLIITESGTAERPYYVGPPRPKPSPPEVN